MCTNTMMSMQFNRNLAKPLNKILMTILKSTKQLLTRKQKYCLSICY